MKHDSPLTLRIAMVIGLGFGIPLIATGLVPLAFGVLVLASPNQLAESGFYGAGFTLVGGLFTAGGLVLIGIDLFLLWGMNGQSVIAWAMTLSLLGLGLWFDLSDVWGRPWWYGLNLGWFLSVGDAPRDLDYWWHVVGVGSSSYVQLGLITCMVTLLMRPSTLAWLFRGNARRNQPPWKLSAKS